MLFLSLAVSVLAAAPGSAAPVWHGELPSTECAVDREPLRVRVQRTEECRGAERGCCVRAERVSFWHPRTNAPVWAFEHSNEGGRSGPLPQGANVTCTSGRVEVGLGREKPVALAFKGPTQALELHESVTQRVSALQSAKSGTPEALAEAQSLVHGLMLVNSLDVVAARQAVAAKGPKVGTGALAEAMLLLAREQAASGQFDSALEQLTELEELDALVPDAGAVAKRAKTLAADIQKKKRDSFPLRIADRRKVGNVPLEVGSPPDTEADLFFSQGLLCLTASTPGGHTRCFDLNKKTWADKEGLESPRLANVEKGECQGGGCQSETCFKLPASADAPNQRREFSADEVVGAFKGGVLILRGGKLALASDVGLKDLSPTDASSFIKESAGTRLFAASEFYIDDTGRIARVATPGTAWELPADEGKAARSPLNAQFPTWKALFASPDQAWVVAAKRELEGAKGRVTEQELWLFKLEKKK
jgi:hypothetical protein